MNSIKYPNRNTSTSAELSKLISKRWNVDLSSRGRIGLTSNSPCDQSVQPVGFVDRSFPHSEAREQDSQLKIKRSWDIALGPLRQVPMNIFIMWMAGNSISIFPILMVYMMFTRSIQALFSLQSSNVRLFLILSTKSIGLFF